jgi:hypothetical protein
MGNIHKSINILKDCLNILENLNFEEAMGEIFKQEGDAKEKFEYHMNMWKGVIYYSLGITYFSINLEKSEEFFKKSLEFSYYIGDIVATIGFIGRKNILSNYAFEFKINEIWNFEKLWELCEKHKFRIDNETLACRCAEYLIYSILTKNPELKKELLICVNLYSMVRTFFYGLCWILGCRLTDLKRTIEILRGYDLSRFPNNINNIENQVYLDTIKIEVEEMYNNYLNGNKKEYEGYKKLVLDNIAEFTQALARIMFFYIINDLETAEELAKITNPYFPKVPREFLKELSEAIEEEIKAKSNIDEEKAKEKVKKAFVKLFYYTV